MGRGDAVLTKVLAIVVAIWLVYLFALVTTRAESGYSTKVTIRMDRDAHSGIRYFRLVHEGASIIVMGDTDIPLIHWLSQHNNERVAVTLEK